VIELEKCKRCGSTKELIYLQGISPNEGYWVCKDCDKKDVDE